MFPLDSTQIKFDEVRRDGCRLRIARSDALALLYHKWRLYNGWRVTPTLFERCCHIDSAHRPDR